jgi:hypothetical protein
MNQKQRTIGFFSLIGLLTILGTCLIVSSCKDSTPAQQQAQQYQPQQQYQQQQAPGQTIVYEQAPQRDHFWEDMFIYHAIFGGNQTTHVHVYQPAPVYRPVYQPAPVVNKTVQNITINQTVNHAPSPAPVAAAKPAVVPGDDQRFTQKAAVAAPVQKSLWAATSAQVVKASTAYPKASNSNTGGYAVKSSGYSSYSQKSSYSSSFRSSSGRR